MYPEMHLQRGAPFLYHRTELEGQAAQAAGGNKKITINIMAIFLQKHVVGIVSLTFFGFILVDQ